MSTQHIRNTIAILLILTLANLGASFAVLYAVHVVRDIEQPARMMRTNSETAPALPRAEPLDRT
jgi:hypothetical protein